MINASQTSSPYLNSLINKNITKNNDKIIQQNKNDSSGDIFEKIQTKEIDTNKTITIKKIKDWLLTPVEVNNPNNIRIAKQTRLTQIARGLAAICIFFIYIISLLKITSGMKMENNLKELPKVSNIWQDITGAQKLGDLALPETLKDTARSLMYKIQNYAKYLEKGGKEKNAILLYGPPGTGKTTFARAIAKEFPNSKFASIDLSAIEDKYVGESQRNLNKAISEVCGCASANPDKKVFVFFDEIDSIAIQDNGSSNQQYHSAVLSALKTAISEKLNSFNNIIVIAATNVDLDKAEDGVGFVQKLSRPIVDRFNKKIRVDNPTEEQLRIAIAKHYSCAKRVADCLKNENSEEVGKIAQELAQKQSSFRVLESLYDAAASSEKEQIGFADVMEALRNLNVPGDFEKKNKIGIVIPSVN